MAPSWVKLKPVSILRESYFPLKLSRITIMVPIRDNPRYQIIHLTLINIANIYKTLNKMKKTIEYTIGRGKTGTS